MTVAKATMLEDTWDQVFTTVATAVTTPKNNATTKWIFSAFPDSRVDNKSDYPFIIVNPPEVSYENIAFGDSKLATLVVPIDIYSTANEELDEISDKVKRAVEGALSTWRTAGLLNPKVTGSVTDTFIRGGGWKIHYKRLNVNIQFYYTQ
jgi:hypothetical protein